MNVFITGASGYIGGSLAVALINRGHRVYGLTRSQSSADKLQSLGINPVIGDLDDTQVLSEQAAWADVVINAANSDHRPAVEGLIAALAGSEKILIHTSGTSLVGDDARGEFRSDSIFSEDTPLLVDPRKQARHEIDLLVMGAIRLEIRSTVVIPSLIYGNGLGLNKNSIQIPFLIRNALEQNAVQIVGKGQNVWSNVHIEDLIDLYLLVIENGPGGNFYFAENGEASFADVAQALSTRLGISKIEHLDAQVAAQRWGVARALFTFGSNCRVHGIHGRRDLGWTPKHNSLLQWISTEKDLY